MDGILHSDYSFVNKKKHGHKKAPFPIFISGFLSFKKKQALLAKTNLSR